MIITSMETIYAIILAIGILELILSLKILAIDTQNTILPLEHVLYIYYLFYFLKNKSNIEALINLSNKINAITIAYI